jgi:hypothetical protein
MDDELLRNLQYFLFDQQVKSNLSVVKVIRTYNKEKEE